MTAFADLIDLQTAVVEMVKAPEIADVFPRLVRLAEADFNRRLRTSDQVVIGSITIAGGSAALPADLQEIIGVYDGAGYELIGQPLQAIQIQQPRGYYAIAGNLIYAPADEVLRLHYYGTIPTIATGPTGSNWVLQRHPGLYFYAVGLEAAKYLGNGELATAIDTVLAGEYAKVASDDRSRRYSRARVRIAGVVP